MTRPTRFTMQALEWVPWIETVNEIGLSESELRAIYEQAPNAKGSPYFATLALDLPALVQRTGLFNSTMRSPGGASNAGRELAATVTSLISGCIYCTSVHAQRYVQYAKKPEVMEQLLASESVRAESLADPREAAILALSVAMIDHEEPAIREVVSRMREIGFSDLEIYDIGQSAAMFAWANRLMQTLGEPAAGVSGF